MEKLFIPLNVKDKFMTAAIEALIKERVDDYNAARYTPDDASMPLVRAMNFLISASLGKSCPPDFGRAICIMRLAEEGREAYRAMTYSARPALESGDFEICRELVLRAIKESSKSDVKNADRAFIPLSEETKDDNVADIMGMIMDELGELPDDDFGDLLDDFGALVAQWRSLELPKCANKGTYELVYELVERCFNHKAYKTAMRLSGLLYVADEPKKKPNLAKTNLLLGMVLYELNYLEVAKRCFIFADEDTKGKCWKDVPEKYHELLNQETRLEVTEEVREKQKFLDNAIASGKFKGYTLEQTREYRAGKLEIEFPDPQKIEKERNKIGEKAIKTYEKNKSVEEALAVFTEDPEVYEQAAYLYFLKANFYLEEDDLENALAAIKKAYNCKNGKINGMVLLTFAIILSKMERFNEANIYIFRTFILFGADFIAEKLGEGALETIEDYL